MLIVNSFFCFSDGIEKTNQWPMVENKVHLVNSRRRCWEKPMTHNKASTNCLGKFHLSDFHAPIEIAVEVTALGNIVHVDLLMLNKGVCWVWKFFV